MSPFKSEAQRRKFHALVKQGKMSMETVRKWEAETGSAKLPGHVEKRPTGIGSIKHIEVHKRRKR